MTQLTLTTAKELINNTIKWTSPAYEGNEDYRGIARIKEVNNSDRPIVCEVIEGDNLNFAFVEKGTPTEDHLCYSDGGRFISFEKVD